MSPFKAGEVSVAGLYALTRVDLRDWSNPDRREDFVSAVRRGMVLDGFILVEGFQGRLEKIYGDYIAACRRLFAHPDSVLARYARPDLFYQRGFSPTGAEKAKDQPPERADLKRFWMTRLEERPENLDDDAFGPNIWPREVMEFQAQALAYMNLLVLAGRVVLSALDESYGFKDGRLCDMTKGSETMLRSIHYPTVDRERARQGAVRSAAHEDINLLTVMKAVAGLQLKVNDEWVDVESPPDTADVNVGEMLPQVAGIEDLKAMTHRVVNPPDGDDSERYSGPCFIHARHSVMLNPYTLAGHWLRDRLAAITAT